MAVIHQFFEQMHARQASDLHLSAGRFFALRIHGEVIDLAESPPIDDDTLQGYLRELVNEVQWTRYVNHCDLDFACQLPGFGRFRANYFVTHAGASAVFRRIPESIVPIEQLGLPVVVDKIAELKGGMVLVTGPTGSGKSTTLAAVIDRINSTRPRQIFTIEDPVEFIHKPKKSIVTQREIGADTLNFASGLSAAISADADVVLVGEMRDLETIGTAVTAASTGVVVVGPRHPPRAAATGVLIFGTLHTNGAAKTVARIIDAFPAEQQPQIQDALSESLAAVISQILIRRADGAGRVAAHEIMVRTSAVAASIRDGNINMLDSQIGAGRRVGMQSMDDALAKLVDLRAITGRDAYLKARDKNRFKHLDKEG